MQKQHKQQWGKDSVKQGIEGGGREGEKDSVRGKVWIGQRTDLEHTKEGGKEGGVGAGLQAAAGVWGWVQLGLGKGPLGGGG